MTEYYKTLYAFDVFLYVFMYKCGAYQLEQIYQNMYNLVKLSSTEMCHFDINYYTRRVANGVSEVL